MCNFCKGAFKEQVKFTFYKDLKFPRRDSG